jgi:hypothetical protein
MTDTDEPNMLAELKATLRERGGDRRSPLFQWMYHNHDALLEMFSDVRPNWPRVTAVLTSRGFTAADGQPLRPESVRKLWHKVRRRHGKARAGTKPKPASAPVEQAAPEPASPDDVLARSRLSKQMVSAANAALLFATEVAQLTRSTPQARAEGTLKCRKISLNGDS